jgi:hypothetical protein
MNINLRKPNSQDSSASVKYSVECEKKEKEEEVEELPPEAREPPQPTPTISPPIPDNT